MLNAAISRADKRHGGSVEDGERGVRRVAWERERGRGQAARPLKTFAHAGENERIQGEQIQCAMRDWRRVSS